MSTSDEFMREEKYTNPIKREELKDELLLDFNNFKEPDVKKNYMALAQKILNLLILEPGTYPDSPEMGINIAKYQFELLTTDMLSTIQSDISRQINTYIPTNGIQKIAVFQNNNARTNTVELIVGFAVGSVNSSTGKFEINNFWIRLAQDAILGLKAQIL